MSFRDMTFCEAYPKDCLNHACRRAVTAEVKAAERQWRGDMHPDPLFAWSDLSPGCNQRVEP